MYDPYKNRIGQFSENDGTIDFYLRVRELVDSDSLVVDLGAGRASWYEDDTNTTRKNIRHISPSISELIAIDVDEAVLDNKASTKNCVYDGEKLPFDDNSIDVLIADFVNEHVDTPIEFCGEIARVLKPGGYYCARTPHKFNYVTLFARLVKNTHHSKVVSLLQPGRKDIDVFPTKYKLNSESDVTDYFPGWLNSSFVFRSDPAYFGGRKLLFIIMKFVHQIAPVWLVGNLFIFLRKPV